MLTDNTGPVIDGPPTQEDKLAEPLEGQGGLLQPKGEGEKEERNG